MPYIGIKDKKLPEYVKKLSDKDIDRWYNIWNAVFEKTKGTKKEKESKAFSIANGLVVKPHNEKKKMESNFLRFEDEDPDNPIVSVGKVEKVPFVKIGSDELLSLEKDTLEFLRNTLTDSSVMLETLLEGMTQERDVLNVVSSHLSSDSTVLKDEDKEQVSVVKNFVDDLVGLEGKSGRLGELLLVIGEAQKELSGSGAVDEKILEVMDNIDRNTNYISGASDLLEGALVGLEKVGESEESGTKYSIKDNIDTAAEIIFDAKGELGYSYGSIKKILGQISEAENSAVG